MEQSELRIDEGLGSLSQPRSYTYEQRQAEIGCLEGYYRDSVLPHKLHRWPGLSHLQDAHKLSCRNTGQLILLRLRGR
jgi:hypothetical protein